MVTRRRFLTQTGSISLMPWLLTHAGCGPSASNESEVKGPASSEQVAFLHGVASGDPLADGVILWTRITVQGERAEAPPLEVEWRIGLDPELSAPAQSGRVGTDASQDYTVKVDVRGLAAATTYYYVFSVGSVASAVGKTRTLPDGHVERLRMGVTSCANYPYGFFHAYRKLAERADLDVVLYLGDYLYEYGNGTYGDGAPLGRVPDPDLELVTLADYRRRHAQYKADADLQALHGEHACVAVWDDHESADNASRQGAANHQAGREGDWSTRRQSAMTAFFEWMPIRPAAPGNVERIYRTFAWGDLADVLMLDTRLIGRDRQVDECNRAQVEDPARSLLGGEQERWLVSQLQSSMDRKTRWRLLGQQVRFAELQDPSTPECSGSNDNWSGYGASRDRLLRALESGIDDVIILTGDSHASWGFDLPRDPLDPHAYDPATGRGSLAVEIIVPGVTSPGIRDRAEATRSEEAYRQRYPNVAFVERHSQGYVIIDVTHERARAEWHFVSSVREPEALERLGGAVEVKPGENHLTPA
jgi:alkaline phosphatase D